jgi:branched-chain amino acid transport system substrate-binding protein
MNHHQAIVHKKVTLLILSLSLTLIGCSDTEVRPTRPVKQLPDYSYQEPESPKLAKALPWELWSPFQDLSGKRLSNPELLLGDELQINGKRRSALDTYLKTIGTSLLPREKEAAAVRIASQYLAVDEAKKALGAVSAYFKEKGLTESQVELPFSLILAYGYGRLGDADQSLAWFAKSYLQSKGNGPGAESARKGTILFLRAVPSTKLEQIAINWRSNSFINECIGRERMRRASRSYDPDDIPSDRPFWGQFDSVSVSESAVSVPLSEGGFGTGVVGVILSLSDRFGALGRDTRHGFELAILGDTGTPPLRVEVRDVGADTAAASAAVRELVAGPRVSVIVGPLLTEAATAAAETARELGVPLVALSKSESFKTSEKIFRLGATSSSQIDSLVQSAMGNFGLSRFAVIAPQSASGTEYVQALRSKVSSSGGTLVFEGTYATADDGTFMNLAQQLEDSGADAVLLPDTIEVAGRFLSIMSPATRKRIRPLGTALWDNAVKIANSQAVFEKALFVTPFFTQSSRSVVRQFVESYRGRYGSTPNFLAAQGFDVGTMVAAALRQSQRDGGSLSDALVRLPPYEGTTGYITVAPPGNISRRMYVVEVTRDSFIEREAGDTSASNVNSAYTYRGNQQVDNRTNELLREKDASVPSGY